MIFGDMKTADAEGAILVHSVKRGDVNFKKGRVLSAGDIAALEAAGIEKVTVSRLEESDVPEDEAAAELALALAGPGMRVGEPFTGRSNLFAEVDGVLTYDPARLDAINLVDEALTVAALAPFETATERQMIGTVKVIPFAASRASLDKAVAIARQDGPLLTLHPFKPHNAGLVATRLATTKESMLDKTRGVLDARLASFGSRIGKEIRCAHEAGAVAGAVATLLAEGFAPVLVFGASAITDRRDILPSGVVQAGGKIVHFGMPVDPGNLMLIATKDGIPVLGLPSCARSPALNGFDWVIARILAGLTVTSQDVMRMGAGGLLKEIATRPQPRDDKRSAARKSAPPDKPAEPRIAAVVLAAGKSSRMGETNKLTAPIDGMPMIARTVDAVVKSGARPVVVVTGHQAQDVRSALAGRDVTFVHNPDYAEGLSTSLRAGTRALPEDIDAAIICLGDMPDITPAHIGRLVAAFDIEESRTICVPTFAGKRGNPVLWGASFFPELASVKGDVGAKHLIGEHADAVCEVAMPDDAPLRDIDTPGELESRQGR